MLDLYNEVPIDFVQSPLLLGSIIGANSRRATYARILSSLRHVMISKMVKPEEVFLHSKLCRFSLSKMRMEKLFANLSKKPIPSLCIKVCENAWYY